MGEVKELGALRSNQLSLEDNLGNDEKCTFRVIYIYIYKIYGIIYKSILYMLFQRCSIFPGGSVVKAACQCRRFAFDP